MNKRIKELYEQCFVVLENDTPNTGFDVNAFAELIVKECASVLRAEMDRLDAIPGREISAQAMETAQVLIKKHFGVE